MDPLSITTGVVGLLSSLTTLSIRINEFRKDVKNATTETSQLTQEVDGLTVILKRLDETRGSLNLPNNLANELGSILQASNRSVIEIELFLKRVSSKRFPGPYWAFSGKSECQKHCRSLESYKSTLNVTLTLSSM